MYFLRQVLIGGIGSKDFGDRVRIFGDSDNSNENLIEDKVFWVYKNVPL